MFPGLLAQREFLVYASAANTKVDVEACKVAHTGRDQYVVGLCELAEYSEQ